MKIRLTLPYLLIEKCHISGILKETLPDDSGFDNHRMMATSSLGSGGGNSNGVTTIKQELDVTSTNNAGDLDSVPATSGGPNQTPPKSKVRRIHSYSAHWS